MHDRTTLAARLRNGIDWAVFAAGSLALSTAILATAAMHLPSPIAEDHPTEFAQARLD